LSGSKSKLPDRKRRNLERRTFKGGRTGIMGCLSKEGDQELVPEWNGVENGGWVLDKGAKGGGAQGT